MPDPAAPHDRPAPVRVLPGQPYPLGATWDGRGTNFALYSENATGVELCLFGEDGTETRFALTEQTAFVWRRRSSTGPRRRRFRRTPRPGGSAPA